MKELPPLDVHAVIKALVDHHVDFVLIGGLAVIAHGVRRATFDADIVIALGHENAGRVAATYAALGVRSANDSQWRDLDPTDAFDIARAGHLQVITDVGRLDVVRHEDYDRVVASSVSLHIAGITVRVVGRDELVAMKLAAGRPRDLLDVADLTAAEREDEK